MITTVWTPHLVLFRIFPGCFGRLLPRTPVQTRQLQALVQGCEPCQQTLVWAFRQCSFAACDDPSGRLDIPITILANKCRRLAILLLVVLDLHQAIFCWCFAHTPADERRCIVESGACLGYIRLKRLEDQCRLPISHPSSSRPRRAFGSGR